MWIVKVSDIYRRGIMKWNLIAFFLEKSQKSMKNITEIIGKYVRFSEEIGNFDKFLRV